MKPGAVLLPALLFFCLLMLSAGCTQPSPAPATLSAVTPAPATSIAIKEYVDNAAFFARQQGRAAALAAFNNRTGPFVTGDVYVYALDYDGNALALPFHPEQVGTNFLNRTDADGKPYTAIEIRLVRAGGGYLLYRYPRPGNGTEGRLKISYVEPVDDTYWTGAGIYTSEDRLVDQELREFVARARTFAAENGREAAAAEFNNISGPFISGDLYIFANDYNGTVLSWPYRPDRIEADRYNDTDRVGTHHVRAMIAAARNGSGMVDYYSVNPRTNRTELKISWVTDVDGTWFIGTGRYMEPGNTSLNA